MMPPNVRFFAGAMVVKLQDYNSLIALGAAQLSDWIHAAGINLSANYELRLKNEECTMPDDPAPKR
jgi:hypothetical protein